MNRGKINDVHNQLKDTIINQLWVTENLSYTLPWNSEFNEIYPTINEAEILIDNYTDKPYIDHGEQSKAYYNSKRDYINTPDKENFNEIEKYYAILYHELAHSTGHEKRLNRRAVTHCQLGTKEYLTEELIAQLSASYLCIWTNINNPETEIFSIAYLQETFIRLHRHSVYNEDEKLMEFALEHAMRAVEYIIEGK